MWIFSEAPTTLRRCSKVDDYVLSTLLHGPPPGYEVRIYSPCLLPLALDELLLAPKLRFRFHDFDARFSTNQCIRYIRVEDVIKIYVIGNPLSREFLAESKEPILKIYNISMTMEKLIQLFCILVFQ